MTIWTETYCEIHTEEGVFGPYCREHAQEEADAMGNVEGLEVISYGGYGRGELEAPELDAPAHCLHNDASGQCAVLLDARLTDDGLEYVRNEIVQKLSDGNTIALDEDSIIFQWHEHYADVLCEKFDMWSLSGNECEAVYDAYVTAQLWTGTINWMSGTNEFGGECINSDGGLDDYASDGDLNTEQLASMRSDVDSFIEMIEPYLGYWETPETVNNGERFDAEQLGHDFSLTRNHHGAGFWDRGLGALGDWLTRCAQSFGESSLSGEVISADVENYIETAQRDTLRVYLEGM